MTDNKKYITSISKEGRILIPGATRKAFKINAGEEIIIKIQNDNILL